MVSVIPSINTSESSSDFLILIISFISSFEINEINPFLALTASFPFSSLPSLSNTFQVAVEAKLLANPGKLSLAKRRAISIILFHLCYRYLN